MTAGYAYLPMPSKLADLLLEAKAKHTDFERLHGTDEHWEKWYALFLRYRMDGIEKDTAAGYATQDLLAKPAVK